MGIGSNWEIEQYDTDAGSIFVRRLAVPGGWLYQTRDGSMDGWIVAPVFVPAPPVSIGRDDSDHGDIDGGMVARAFAPIAAVDRSAPPLPSVEVHDPTGRRTMFARVLGPVTIGELALVEVPPNCSIHSADAAGLARMLTCARVVGEHWRNQDGINAGILDELGEATADYWKDGEPCETPCGDPACGPAGGDCRKGKAI